MTVTISEESPLTAGLELLFERHSQAMHADTPPESIHMMDRGALEHPAIRFFVLRDSGEALAMGAFKRIEPGHAESKSMHVLHEARGRGLSRKMLAHLIAEAQAEGQRRMSLETGPYPSFLAARELYRSAGFTECSPFIGYSEDPNSVFMTLDLG